MHGQYQALALMYDALRVELAECKAEMDKIEGMINHHDHLVAETRDENLALRARCERLEGFLREIESGLEYDIFNGNVALDIAKQALEVPK